MRFQGAKLKRIHYAVCSQCNFPIRFDTKWLNLIDENLSSSNPNLQLRIKQKLHKDRCNQNSSLSSENPNPFDWGSFALQG